MWLGAAACVDLLVTQNTDTTERFMAAPGSPATVALIKQATPKSIRFLLRRNAEEESAWILENREWTEIAICIVYFLLILFADRPPKSVLVLLPAMLAILVLQRFVFTPQIASLAREVDEIPGKELLRNPIVGRYWAFRGFYAGGEILKLLLGLAVGMRLMTRRVPDRSPAKEPHMERTLAKETTGQDSTEERQRKRRRTTDRNG